MPFNGNGQFARIRNWTNEAGAGVPILPDEFDEQEEDFATGFGNCITRDGQGGPTADIPWNNFGITGLRAPILGGDAANKTYVDTATAARSMGGFQLTSVAAPTLADDAANRSFVETATAARSMGGFQLNNLGYPTANTDAASMRYVLDTAMSTALPNQSGNAGKFVTTNGTTASFQVVVGNSLYINANLGGF